MKHVWIINHYGQEPGHPGSVRHFALAKNLESYGWRASIVAASTEHVTGRQRLAPGERSRLEHHEGVTFLWLRTGGYSGNGADRVLNMLQYTWAALRPGNLAALAPPDAVIGSSVHPLAAWAGARLARRCGVPFLFEVRDLWPQTLVDMGRLRENSLATRALRWLERDLYRTASRTIVLLPLARNYITPLGIEANKIVWIPNGVDLNAFPCFDPRCSDGRGDFTVMYFGAHGQANSLENVLKAAKLLEQRPIARRMTFRLIGDGPDKPALQRLAAELGLSGVTFENPVPKADIPALAAQADAFVLSVRNLPDLYRFGISMNKLFDYLAAGRPIILASAAPNNPVADAGAGITVPPEQPQALADAIERIAQSSGEERRAMGLAGRRHVEAHYNYRFLAGRLAGALNGSCAASLDNDSYTHDATTR